MRWPSWPAKTIRESPRTRSSTLRDCYDHVVQVVELIETYRELTADLRDLYMSSLSNRINETMRILTIFSTFFIPLTFIVGIYGMNFDWEGGAKPLNMPELHWRYGYPTVWVAMLASAAVMLVYFYRRGWILRFVRPFWATERPDWCNCDQPTGFWSPVFRSRSLPHERGVDRARRMQARNFSNAGAIANCAASGGQGIKERQMKLRFWNSRGALAAAVALGLGTSTWSAAQERDGIAGVREQDQAATRTAAELNGTQQTSAAGQAQAASNNDLLMRAGIVIDARNANRMIVERAASKHSRLHVRPEAGRCHHPCQRQSSDFAYGGSAGVAQRLGQSARLASGSERSEPPT